jgi:hypothetical protein
VIYAVYDRATKKIARKGIAPDEHACGLQINDPAAQDMVAAQDADALAIAIHALGLIE